MKDGKITVMYPINMMDIGGAQQRLLEIVKGLDKERFKPIILTLYPGGELEPEVRQIPGAELMSINRKGKYDFWVIPRMSSLLRQNHVNIVHTFLTPAIFFGLISGIISRTPVKLVAECCGERLDTNPGRRISYRKMQDFLARFADWVVPNSQAGGKLFTDRGISPNHIKVIYNGINFKRLAPDWTKVAQIRNQMGLSPDGKAVGITARLSPEKDHATFLQGAKIIHQAMPQTRFAILGDGPLRPTLENMVRELGMVPYVTFFGFQRDVGSYVSACDVACLTSLGAEGLSSVTLEAMALGRPVVITNVGGNAELVDHGKNGLLIPPRNPQALADAVLDCLRRPDWVKEMGQRAREMVESQYSLEHMIHEHEQFYEHALRVKRGG
jgi:glycosyltransferase involved in cell wall biosynthesis